MKPSTILITAAVLLLGVALLAGGYVRQPDVGEMNLNDFGKLPVVHQGRVKPLDTVARNALRIISDKSEFEDAAGEKRPAIVWLADAMTLLEGNDAIHEHKVFRIDHDQLVDALGVEARPGSWRYSLDELEPKLAETYDMAAAASELEPEDRSLYQNKLLELSSHLDVYSALASHKAPLVVPLKIGDELTWLTLPQAHHLVAHEEMDPAVFGVWRRMLIAYSVSDAGLFNEELAAYQQMLSSTVPDAVDQAVFEWRFNRFAPFYQCSVLMVIVFLLGSIGMLTRFRPLVVSAAWLAGLALLVWGAALIGRMIIQDRPFVFVTNLYSSAVFIGWVAVAFALVFEAIFRLGLPTMIAAVVGFATLLVAHHLAGDGDTLEMMQAVLDTNFWLATHVTTITIGYAVTFLAGALGVCYVLGGVFTRWINPKIAKSISTMIYGTVCFSLLFSFVGTVLGGIWADQSWGRFWGWDPKENGALIIVIWNALILHARWGGIVKARGIAVLAIFGNVVTTWSWFGVNMLGVGLHTYADASGAHWLIGFITVQLLFMAIGMIPLSRWRSQTTRNPLKRQGPPGGSVDRSTGGAPPPLPAR